jgi:hypothetical protein
MQPETAAAGPDRAKRGLWLGVEAEETLACSYLSFALLVGLSAHAAEGCWWADPVAGATHEGVA